MISTRHTNHLLFHCKQTMELDRMMCLVRPASSSQLKTRLHATLNSTWLLAALCSLPAVSSHECCFVEIIKYKSYKIVSSAIAKRLFLYINIYNLAKYPFINVVYYFFIKNYFTWYIIEVQPFLYSKVLFNFNK